MYTVPSNVRTENFSPVSAAVFAWITVPSARSSTLTFENTQAGMSIAFFVTRSPSPLFMEESEISMRFPALSLT